MFSPLSGDEDEDEMDAGARDDDDAEDYTAPVLEARTGGDGSSSEAGSLDSFQQYQVSKLWALGTRSQKNDSGVGTFFLSSFLF